MQIKKYGSARKYLAENLEYLEKEEAINSLLIGISLANLESKEDSTLYISIRDEESIRFTAIQTQTVTY